MKFQASRFTISILALPTRGQYVRTTHLPSVSQRSKVFVVAASIMLALVPCLKAPVRAAHSAEDQIFPEAAGDLDPTFGQGGKVLTTLFNNHANLAQGIAIQPDGKIVAAGYTEAVGSDDRRFGLARYNADGSLDTNFGTAGTATAAFSGHYDTAYAVAVQPDGKIVAVGQSHADASFDSADFAVARYNANGALDTTFSGQGRRAIPFTGGGSETVAYAVVIQTDGKILLAGQTADFALLRLNPDGSTDTGFGASGFVRTDFFGGQDGALSVALQPDGKILAAGFATTAQSTLQFAIARYNTDGSPDSSFGAGGKATTDLSHNRDFATSMALQPDGRIVVAGATQPTADRSTKNFGVARYNPDGSLDTTFGPSDGKFFTDFFGTEDEADAIAVQSTGKILVAGFNTAAHRNFALVRYNPDGSQDTSFAGGGITTDFGHPASAQGLAVQPDGNIVVAGWAGTQTNGSTFALTRYLSGPDFALGFASPSVAGDRGTKVKVFININRGGGFTGNVTVTPPDTSAIGVKVKPPDPQATTDSGIVVKLKIGGGAAPGAYKLKFTGKDDAGHASTNTLLLTIQ